MKTKINYLFGLEEIASSAAGCKMDFTSVADDSNELSEAACFLDLTCEQTVLFACIAELSFRKSVTLEVLAKHFGCSVLRIIAMLGDLETLERRHYIRKSVKKGGTQKSYSDIGYNVPESIFEAIRKGDAGLLTSTTRLDLTALTQSAADLIDKCSEGILTEEELQGETEYLISQNANLPMVSLIDETLSGPSSKCIALAMCYWRLKERIHISIEALADSLFLNLKDHLEFEEEVTTGRHELVRRNIVRMSSGDFETDKTITLEDNVVKRLWNEFPGLVLKETYHTGVIRGRSIPVRKLFFNKRLTSQINELSAVLRPAPYLAYCRAMRSTGIKPGVTVMFSGKSGTGKTEAVYQLSRNTGRDLCMTDLSETKSKWFGESEKQVRKIFTEYEHLRKNSAEVPILFFNEADGLFGRRIESGMDSSSSDQTFNTIQNVLLQSLEDFEGILMATTNLSVNLDRAFERRFSFRIEFTKPDIRCRAQIWRSKLPELTAKEAETLAGRYELTGADIDVHIRHLLLKKALCRKSGLFQLLDEICAEDRGFHRSKSIGFRR